MGSRGPQPTPTAILAARGSTALYERKNEPMDAVEAPPCPDWLKGEARREWFRIVPVLLARRTVSQADFGHLAGMCDWWGQYVAARIAVRKLKGKAFTGFTVDHPRVILSQAWKSYVDAARQFGLSPASRTRVVSGEPERDTNGKGRFFQRDAS